MAYIPRDFLKCVVFLGYEDKNRQERLAGSAFWISRPGPEDVKQYRPAYLVTAGHVIDHISKNVAATDNRVRIRVNTKEGGQRWEDTAIRWWKRHPDPSVDVAVLKQALDNDLDHFAWPTEAFVTEKTMRDDGRKIELGDELFVAGLFWPHTGENKNIPIVRIGNVAALREEPVLNRAGKLMDAYLVESRSTAGLSGSPVFIDIVAAKHAYPGERRFVMGNFPSKYRLIGMMHGHFEGPDAQSDLIADDGRAHLLVNMGIAMVTPAEKILEVLSESSEEELKEIEAARSATHSSVLVGSSTEARANATAQVTITGFEIPKGKASE